MRFIKSHFIAIGMLAVALILFLEALTMGLAATAFAQSATTGTGASAGTSATATSTETTAQKQAALENQLTELEGQIDQYQGQITVDEQKGSSLTGTINKLNAQIAKLNLQIQATNLTLEDINTQITDTQSQIVTTASAVASKKTTIGNLLQTLYESDHTTLMEAFLANPQISNLWDDAENISLFEAGLSADVAQLNTLSGQLQDQNQALDASQSAAQTAIAYAAAQAAQVASTKTQENQLLTATKNNEAAVQTLVTQTKQTAAQIRAQIFQLLGGGSLTFEQAYQYASLASKSTGVDAALILAILDRESALGQNVGQCSYQKAMSPANIPIFLSIVKGLGLNPSSMLVSCPNADGVYGGAMGPAQFEPSTWELFVSQIGAITGDNPPSPWSNADAFVATALYLKGAQTGCESVYTATLDIDRCIAAKYYAGNGWRNYLSTYGQAVVNQEQVFQQDIATINGS